MILFSFHLPMLSSSVNCRVSTRRAGVDLLHCNQLIPGNINLYTIALLLSIAQFPYPIMRDPIPTPYSFNDFFYLYKRQNIHRSWKLNLALPWRWESHNQLNPRVYKVEDKIKCLSINTFSTVYYIIWLQIYNKVMKVSVLNVFLAS